MDKMILAEKVTKEYRIFHRPGEKYLDFFFAMKRGERFFALRDVSFTVERGEAVGLLGLNGSGKSTLSNIIAGIAEPSEGTMTVAGSVSMTSVSGGLIRDLTGLENIVQQGLLLGLSHKQIKELTPGIIEFADLGPFIDQQVKTYSSGMRSRLAFSINVNIDPDVMVIDEALSVGDPTFTDKCMKKMQEFREKGKTIIFVSHSMGQIRDFCDRALWLEAGQIKMDGSADDVVGEYGDFISYYNRLNPQKKKEIIGRLRAAQLERLGPDESDSSLTGYREYQKEQKEQKEQQELAESQRVPAERMEHEELILTREDTEVIADGNRLVMRNHLPGGAELSFAWYVQKPSGEKYAQSGYRESREYEAVFPSTVTGDFCVKAYVMEDTGRRVSGIFWAVTVEKGQVTKLEPISQR